MSASADTMAGLPAAVSYPICAQEKAGQAHHKDNNTHESWDEHHRGVLPQHEAGSLQVIEASQEQAEHAHELLRPGEGQGQTAWLLRCGRAPEGLQAAS